MEKQQPSPKFNLTGTIPEFPDYTPSPKVFNILNKYYNLDSRIEEIRINYSTIESTPFFFFDLEDAFTRFYKKADFYETSEFYNLTQEEKEILHKESRSLVEYFSQLCEEFDYLGFTEKIILLQFE